MFIPTEIYGSVAYKLTSSHIVMELLLPSPIYAQSQALAAICRTD